MHLLMRGQGFVVGVVRAQKGHGTEQSYGTVAWNEIWVKCHQAEIGEKYTENTQEDHYHPMGLIGMHLKIRSFESTVFAEHA